MGVEIVAFDATPGQGHYVDGSCFTTVYPGDHRVLSEIPRLRGWGEHALMLCWPPYSETMASDCLDTFQGDTVIYIGERQNGCTGDDKFFEDLTGNVSGTEDEQTGEWWVDGVELVVDWKETITIAIPQWEGIHDYLTIYQREVKQ
jgi:hypothetical protein